MPVAKRLACDGAIAPRSVPGIFAGKRSNCKLVQLFGPGFFLHEKSAGASAAQARSAASAAFARPA